MSIVWLSGIGVALDFKLRRVWLCDGCRRCAWSGSMWQRGAVWRDVGAGFSSEMHAGSVCCLVWRCGRQFPAVQS